MTDTEILDWIQEHLDGLRQTLQDDEHGEPLYEMIWIDDTGKQECITRGSSLRECVLSAIKETK